MGQKAQFFKSQWQYYPNIVQFGSNQILFEMQIQSIDIFVQIYGNWK